MFWRLVLEQAETAQLHRLEQQAVATIADQHHTVQPLSIDHHQPRINAMKPAGRNPTERRGRRRHLAVLVQLVACACALLLCPRRERFPLRRGAGVVVQLAVCSHDPPRIRIICRASSINQPAQPPTASHRPSQSIDRGATPVRWPAAADSVGGVGCCWNTADLSADESPFRRLHVCCKGGVRA